MKLQGSLAERDVPDLIQALHQSGFTGVVTLTHAGVGRRVIMQEGRLVFATSSDPDDRMGELLLLQGKITLRQYVDAGRAVAPGKRLGGILVEHGILTPKELVKVVTEQTQHVIYRAFEWTEGQYRIQEGVESSEAITLKISTPDIILEGIHRIEAWSRIVRAVGGLEAQYERRPDFERELPSLTLSIEKLNLLVSLTKPASVEAICNESPMPDFEVCRTLWAYRVIGIVRRMDVPAVRPPLDEDEGLGFVLPED
jgi:Domain of unknown function (DUF4388)